MCVLPHNLVDKREMAFENDIVAHAKSLAARAKALQPLTAEEVEGIVRSMMNVQRHGPGHTIDFDALRSLLSEVGHLSHKDWAVTIQNSHRLGEVILPAGITPTSEALFERILHEGNWNGGVHGGGRKGGQREKPWAVLVTGVNGIRKTTSMYQKWFPDLLSEALRAPEGAEVQPSTIELPHGGNSFFRQLDHMIATLCNDEFATLYRLASLERKENGAITPDVVRKYTGMKAGIFSRYRTVSELLGVVLLSEAKKVRSNCLMETSGKDVAMFHYIDAVFPEGYRKLALHFTINDLGSAQASVDARMVEEIKAGIQAVEANDVMKVIRANAGGPYGSAVLPDVQAASDSVWNERVLSKEVGKDWYKATISITAHASRPWSAAAVLPDGSLGKSYEFIR